MQIGRNWKQRIEVPLLRGNAPALSLAFNKDFNISMKVYEATQSALSQSQRQMQSQKRIRMLSCAF